MTDPARWSWSHRMIEYIMLGIVCALLGWFLCCVYGPKPASIQVNAPGATILPQEFNAQGPPIIMYQPPEVPGREKP